MAIKVSSAKHIDALIADLTGGNAVSRDAAVARLTVIGARAVERVLALADSAADASARAAAFRILEGIGDPRALDPALRAIGEPEAAVALAGVGVARVFVRGPRGAAAVDRLTATVLSRAELNSVRVAALRALGDLDAATIAPILDALADDPNPAIRAALDGERTRKTATATDPSEMVTRAATEALPDDPAALRHAVARAGADFALPVLLQLLERVREREGSERASRRLEWTTTRAAIHVALASRHSRIALYDLRETIESADTPLPVEFLAALSLIGDTSCLESIASAYARSVGAGRSQHDWWRQHLAEGFRTVMARERLTRRHAAVKKIEKRWKGAVDELLQ